MGWLDYYRLLEKYSGDLKNAKLKELNQAARNNPLDPVSARQLAEKKWKEKQERDNNLEKYDKARILGI